MNLGGGGARFRQPNRPAGRIVYRQEGAHRSRLLCCRLCDRGTICGAVPSLVGVMVQSIREETIMQKFVWRSVLGVSVIAGSFAVNVPANATLWQNASVNGVPRYLTVPNTTTPGQATYVFHYTGFVSQNWVTSPDPAAPGFVRLFSGMSRSNNLALDVAGGSMSNGTSIIDANSSGGATQSWYPIFRQTINGAACYSFHNRASPAKVIMQWPDIGAVDNDPVVIWDYFGGPGEFWCAYVWDSAGNLVPQNPPPF